MHLTDSQVVDFKKNILSFYQEQGRVFSWRNIDNSYYIVVSEIMLQQTQTQRVVSKYEAFIAVFPSWSALANASINQVLCVWQGLGYNRRALSLHAIAKQIVADFGSELPDDSTVLVQFPGIGKATAASICAFAFNKPTVFIETNIRTVFIYSFFKDAKDIKDDQLLPLISQTLDVHNPRTWYYALMDYGVMLKKSEPNPNRKSSHYTKQSKFEDSNRQIRGAIIRLLTQKESFALQDLISILNKNSTRVATQIEALYKEGFITYSLLGKIMLRNT